MSKRKVTRTSKRTTSKKKTAKKVAKKVTKKVAKKAAPNPRQVLKQKAGVAKPAAPKDKAAAASAWATRVEKKIVETTEFLDQLQESIGGDFETVFAKIEKLEKTLRKVLTAIPQEIGLTATVEPKAEEEEESYTLEDVQNALKEVQATDGMDRVKEIINTFGAARVSDIAVSDYPSVIEAAEGPSPIPETAGEDNPMDLFS